MKNFHSISMITCMALFGQCGSSGDEPNPNPNTGDLVFTSLSPSKVYPDDEVTIIGTGFSKTKTDNIVKLGIYGNGIFTEVKGAGGDDPSYSVVSASETSLVVKANFPDYVNLSVADYYEYAFQITVGDHSVFAPFGKMNRFISFNMNYTNTIDRVSGCFLYVQAGDSVLIEGNSFTGNCSLFINNKAVPNVKKVGDGNNKLTFRVPRDHFGNLEDDCLEDEFEMKIVNGDNKSKTKLYHFAKSPPMRIHNASFDKASYPQGSSNAVLTVTGYALYSSAMVRLSSANGYSKEGNLGATSYTDLVKTDFNIGGLQPGVYNLQIKQSEDKDYAFSWASFEIK